MSASAIALPFNYGAHELKTNYRKFLVRAGGIAVAIHFLGIGVYWGSIFLAREEEPTRMVRILKYSELGPPPSVTSSSAAPAIAVAAAAVKPSVGIPVPVPDAEVNPEQTIATQEEMAQIGPIGEGEGSGVQQVIEEDIKIEDDGPPPDFVPFEKPPQIIKQVKPAYPDIARKAALEGTVILKIWIDKEGKVRKAEVLRSDAELFNQPAIDAAMKFVFTPALQGDKPVSVWLSMPFRFKLQ